VTKSIREPTFSASIDPQFSPAKARSMKRTMAGIRAPRRRFVCVFHKPMFSHAAGEAIDSWLAVMSSRNGAPPLSLVTAQSVTVTVVP
jgi:hypothetical protein